MIDYGAESANCHYSDYCSLLHKIQSCEFDI